MANTIPTGISIKKRGRYWAVYLGDDLLAITVYKKGAYSIKAAWGGLVDKMPPAPETGPAPTLTFAELAQWNDKKFQNYFLSAQGLSMWKKLCLANLDAALQIAAKALPESIYAWFAFASQSKVQKQALLRAFVQGDVLEIYWPVVVACFVDILMPPRGMNTLGVSLVSHLANGFARLSASQKQVALERITSLITWDVESTVLSRTAPPTACDLSDFSILKYGAVLADEQLRSFLQKTVGQVGFHFFCPQLDELNVTIGALGGNAPLWYYLTLDFATEPINGNVLQKDPWEFNGDSIPSAPVVGSVERKIAKTFQTPLDQEPIFDYFGCYFWDEKVGPHIVLRIHRIAEQANRLAIPFEHLLVVAWIHQFAHLLHLAIPDPDGNFNPSISHLYSEIIAQWATWKTVEKQPLLKLCFETLSNNQSDTHHAWEFIKHLDKQEVSSFLWCVRSQRVGFNRAELEKKMFGIYSESDP